MSGMKPQNRRFRALIKLVYSDLIEGKEGQPLAEQGEITELYPELVARPDLIDLLIARGMIEEVPAVSIVRPGKTEPKEEKE